MISRQLEGLEGRSNNAKEEIVIGLETQENIMFHAEANHPLHSRTGCNFSRGGESRTLASESRMGRSF